MVNRNLIREFDVSDEDWSEAIGDALLDGASPLGEWFRRDALQRLWSEHQSGGRDQRKKLWTMFCLATAVRNTATPLTNYAVNS